MNSYGTYKRHWTALCDQKDNKVTLVTAIRTETVRKDYELWLGLHVIKLPGEH